MAAKFFTGLPLDGPDPECVSGTARSLWPGSTAAATPRPAMDHTRPTAATASPVLFTRKPVGV